jgi:hypothetical protein
MFCFWFVGIGVDYPAWDHSVVSKNRDRLLQGDIAAKVLVAVLAQLKATKLSVDGTLIGAWASMKSVRPKHGSAKMAQASCRSGGGRNAEADFHCQKRLNESMLRLTNPAYRDLCISRELAEHLLALARACTTTGSRHDYIATIAYYWRNRTAGGAQKISAFR